MSALVETFLSGLERASDTRFGDNSVKEYLIVLLVLVLGVLFSRAARFILGRALPRLASLTATDLDDRLVDGAVGPLSAMVLLPFGHVCAAILTMPASLHQVISHGLTIAFDVLFAILLLRAVDVLFRHGIARWVHTGRSAEEQDRDGRAGVASQAIDFARKFTKCSVIIFVGIGVLRTAGFDIVSLITGLGIGGLAVALAAQETLGNILGSLQIMTDRPFDVGDFIQYEGHSGRVTHVGLRSSNVLTSTGVRVIVPNKKLAEAPIQNLSVHKGLTIVTDLALTYETSADELERAMAGLREVVTQEQGTHADVRVHFMTYSDHSLDLRLVYFITDHTHWVDVKSRVNLAIRRRFGREGFEFAFPTQTLHLIRKEGDEPKPDHL